jgi:hypothetical protein
MKNRILAWTALLIVFLSACRKTELAPIDQFASLAENHIRLVSTITADQVAVKFNPGIFLKTPGAKPSQQDNKILNRTVINDRSNTPALYVYNLEGKGCLMVSADSSIQPVLAYAEHARFDIEDFKTGKVPGGLIQWLNKTLLNAEAVRKGTHDNDLNGTIAWKSYFPSQQKAVPGNSDVRTDWIPEIPDPCSSDPDYYSAGGNRVGPLLTTNWGQGDTYNNFLANVGCSGNGSPPAGCVAVAMAQVLRYWQAPSAYNFSNMPDDHGNADVRQLIQDAGTSVNMVYDCSGSAPYQPEVWLFDNIIIGVPTTDHIANAFINDFGYSSATSNFYNRTTDAGGMVSNIIAGTPVILCGNSGRNSFFGFPTGSGHCWVCDGYNEAIITFCVNGGSQTTWSLMLHMNWGWGYANDPFTWNGWFGFSNWYTPGTSADYQYFNEAAANIHP